MSVLIKGAFESCLSELKAKGYSRIEIKYVTCCGTPDEIRVSSQFFQPVIERNENKYCQLHASCYRSIHLRDCFMLRIP
jgi:methyl coenzyme M reductase subunit C-like uncharacterized protein (methanogenesis marker protein 7)